MPDVRITAPNSDAQPVRGRSLDDLRRAAAELARATEAERLVVDASALSGDRLSAVAEALLLGAYRFTLDGEPGPSVRIELAGAGDAEAVERGRRAAAAAGWARDLANTPAGTCNPGWLGAQATRRLRV